MERKQKVEHDRLTWQELMSNTIGVGADDVCKLENESRHLGGDRRWVTLSGQLIIKFPEGEVQDAQELFVLRIIELLKPKRLISATNGNRFPKHSH